MSFIRKRSSDSGKIDISPMLDIVFILLIFFVVTSTFTRETGVDVTKPKASSAKELAKESILIGVTRQGLYRVRSWLRLGRKHFVPGLVYWPKRPQTYRPG